MKDAQRLGGRFNFIMKSKGAGQQQQQQLSMACFYFTIKQWESGVRGEIKAI